MKLYERGTKYKQRMLVKNEELKKLKEEVKNLIEERNDEINSIRDNID